MNNKTWRTLFVGHLSKLDDSGEVLLNKVFEKGFSHT